MKLVPWSFLSILAVSMIVAAVPSLELISVIPSLAFGSPADDLAPQADQFFAGDNSTFTDPKWGSSAAGPFGSSFIPGNVANFAKVNGIGTGSGSIIVGGLNATENFTFSFPSGALSTGGTVVPITVAAGKTLDLGNLSISTAAGTGFIKNGDGIYSSLGNTFSGGFTVNAGTVIARHVNTMGSGLTNTLTINGGTIASDGDRDFTSKFGGGITIGGNIQLGELAANIPAVQTQASLTFGDKVSLGASTRTIAIGAGGGYRFNGVISGASGAGLTVIMRPGGSGAISLNAANTYTGNTTILSGTLTLAPSGSIAASPVIEIAGGAIFNVSSLSSLVNLSNGQALRGSGTTTSGRINSTNGITTASNSPIQFTSFNGSTPPLSLGGSGNLTLKSTNPVTVTITNGGNPLGTGLYKLISKLSSGSVVGLPTVLTVNGDNVLGTPSLELISGELFLRVTADTTPPASPLITSSNPASPGTSLTPDLLGTSEANSLVRIYRSADCSGSPVGTQQLSAGATAFSIAVTANANTATSFSALATDASGNVSACSTPYVYQHGVPPAVTTNLATLVAIDSATLNGMASPQGSAATGWFRYSTVDPGACNDSFGTRAPVSGGTALGSGTGLVDYSQAISGLLPGTTYYFCAIAQNSAGTGFGFVQNFTTGTDTAAPVITYTPLDNVATVGDRILTVNVTDNVGVASVSIIWENNGSPVAEISGCVQSGTNWDCTIPSAAGSPPQSSPGFVTYTVFAADAANNQTLNPTGSIRNLFTIGDDGVIDTSINADFDTLHIGGGWSFSGDALVWSSIDIEANVDMAGHTLTLGCDADFVGAGPSAYVIGNVRKEFCGPETFTFPVGTIPDNAFADKTPEGVPQEYSPFTADVTAVNGMSSLTVSASDEVMSGMYAAQSVSRWWDVTESGDLTANISYTWLDVDVAGNESAYSVIRREAFAAVYPGGTVDAGTNTASAPGVTDFSGWSAGFLIPTASMVTLGGRATDANGRGLMNAIVDVKTMDGTLVGTGRTGSFGYFTVEGLTAGNSYTVYITSKRYTFAPQVIAMRDNLDGVDFTANP